MRCFTRVVFGKPLLAPLCVLISMAVAWSAIPAQGTVLHATVADANTGDYILDASVSVDPAGLNGITDISGDARFAELKKGRYVIHVRRMGYAPIDTDLLVTGRDSVEATFMMRPISHELATVTVEAAAASAFLREFDDRRKQGKGHFITDSLLHASFASPLRDIMASRFPGIRILDRPDGSYIVSSTRGSNHIGSGGLCPVAVYWNGIRLGFDPSVIPQAEVGGVEFYSAGSAPVQYQWPGHDCGVLLLWQRP